jgi:hypothetical protein
MSQTIYIGYFIYHSVEDYYSGEYEIRTQTPPIACMSKKNLEKMLAKYMYKLSVKFYKKSINCCGTWNLSVITGDPADDKQYVGEWREDSIPDFDDLWKKSNEDLETFRKIVENNIYGEFENIYIREITLVNDKGTFDIIQPPLENFPDVDEELEW